MRRPLKISFSLGAGFAALLSIPSRSLAEPSPPASLPTPRECAAAIELSNPLVDQGKLRAARAQLVTCSRQSCSEDVRTDCQGRLTEVSRRIPTIVFEASDGAGHDLSEVAITMDGEPLVARLDGSPVELDLGPHKFRFEVVGLPAIEKTFLVAAGEKARREEVIFATVATTAPVVPSRPTRGPKIGALVSLGVGVVGVAIGTVFGALAISRHDDAVKICPGDCATADGVTRWNEARSAGTVSTAAFVVGGAGLAAGALLWFLPHRGSADVSTAWVSIGPGGAAIAGTWR